MWLLILFGQNQNILLSNYTSTPFHTLPHTLFCTFLSCTHLNFLRGVQLKWFHFRHHSHTTESVHMEIIFWQTDQNHFELFFLSQSFKHPVHAESSKYYSIRWSSTYFSSLTKYDIVLRSDFNFPFVTSTPLRALFAVDVETTHSKRVLSFSALFNLMNGTTIFFELFLLAFLKREDL